MAKMMRIHHLLDLPLVSQSSGQTRRGRIAAAIMSKPLLLLLEDPMAGLDIKSRDEVSELLGRLNYQGGIRVVLVLRAKGADSMPEWITDICSVQGGDVWVGSRSAWEQQDHTATTNIEEIEENIGEMAAEPVVKLNDVSVSYGEGSRPVLKNISWEIKPGERWHLQGSNGGGAPRNCADAQGRARPHCSRSYWAIILDHSPFPQHLSPSSPSRAGRSPRRLFAPS